MHLSVSALPTDVLDQVAARVACHLSESLGSPRDWLTVDEAAAHIGATRQRIYDLRSAGRLPRTGDGTRVLVHREDLDRHVLGT